MANHAESHYGNTEEEEGCHKFLWEDVDTMLMENLGSTTLRVSFTGRNGDGKRESESCLRR
jgi:hypothetical protein